MRIAPAALRALLWMRPRGTTLKRSALLDAPLEPLEPADIALRGVRRLAGAVLLLALRDLERRDDDEHRQSALRFFEDDDSHLAFWCGVLDVDPAEVEAKAEALGPGRGSSQPKLKRRSRPSASRSTRTPTESKRKPKAQRVTGKSLIFNRMGGVP